MCNVTPSIAEPLPHVWVPPPACLFSSACSPAPRLGPVELHLGVRDTAVGALTALGGLTALHLTASFYITGTMLEWVMDTNLLTFH